MRTSLPMLVTIAALACGGCSWQPSESVFGEPSKDKLFEPFQGEWTLVDRKFDPPIPDAKFSGGPDISVTGHIIRFAYDPLVSELRLCQTRATDDGIACEAWYHEDMHDPGDMQRADCQLRMNGDKLELQWRILDGGYFSNDPVIASPNYVPPDRHGNADELLWWIETYSRKAAE